MGPVFWLIDTILAFLFWVIFINAVTSWLVAFNVVNPYNQVVRAILEFLNKVSEPLCRPIRRIMPDLGGIDLSPMVVLLLIMFIRMYIPAV
jgi:YggT family protein